MGCCGVVLIGCGVSVIGDNLSVIVSVGIGSSVGVYIVG